MCLEAIIPTTNGKNYLHFNISGNTLSIDPVPVIRLVGEPVIEGDPTNRSPFTITLQVRNDGAPLIDDLQCYVDPVFNIDHSVENYNEELNAEEDINPETGELLFNSFFDAFYWAACTLTTVGYGDLYPISEIGRGISIISSMVGIAIIALPSGIITAGYMDEMTQRREEKKEEKKE